MKTSKSELKKIVKECLIEILNEGLGGATMPPGVIKKTLPINDGANITESRKKVTPAPRQPTPHLRAAIRAEAGGNPLMEAIFADTASTTLAQQIAFGDVSTPAPGVKSHGIVQQEQVVGNPEDLFGAEAASKWANLAFTGTETKK